MSFVLVCDHLVDFQELLFSDVLKIPSEEDLESAALALIKLQETYKLYPVNITKGKSVLF